MPDVAEPERSTGTTASEAEIFLKGEESPEATRAAHVNADMLEYLIAGSLGADPGALSLYRYLPVEIYLDGEAQDVQSTLLLALVNFMRDDEFRRLGFGIHSVGPTERGSFRLTFVLRSLERLTLHGVHEVVEGIKAACDSVLQGLPREPGKEDQAATLAQAQSELARAQTKLTNAQIELTRAQTMQTKAKTYLAVAAFLVTTLTAGVTGYIQWAHLRAEKPTPESPITVTIIPAAQAFTVPH